MTAIDRLIPTPRLLEIDHVELAAAPERVWERVRHGNLATSPLARGLFALRTLPERLSGRSPEPARLQLDDLRSSTDAPGFQILVDNPPHEVAVGAIGKVWQLEIPFLHVDGAEAFERFREPGWIKVAWTLRMLPLGESDTRLEIEVRVDATDEDAWKRFRRYFRLVGPGSHFIRRSALATLERELGKPRDPKARAEGKVSHDDWRDVLAGLGGAAQMALALATPFRRPQRARWGVDAETAARVHPGDERIPRPRWGWTHGVEIDAPAEAVWGWIAQIGVGRGGFYSYQWLENLAGCDLENAERVHPEWEIQPGDRVLLHPKMPPLLAADVARGKHLVLYAAPDEAARAAGKPWAAASWLFLVEPLGPERCRLVSRYRCDFSSDLGTRLSMGSTFVEPIGFAMDRRMLRGVKERAEAKQRRRPLRHVGPLAPTPISP